MKELKGKEGIKRKLPLFTLSNPKLSSRHDQCVNPQEHDNV